MFMESNEDPFLPYNCENSFTDTLNEYGPPPSTLPTRQTNAQQPSSIQSTSSNQPANDPRQAYKANVVQPQASTSSSSLPTFGGISQLQTTLRPPIGQSIDCMSQMNPTFGFNQTQANPSFGGPPSLIPFTAPTAPNPLLPPSPTHEASFSPPPTVRYEDPDSDPIAAKYSTHQPSFNQQSTGPSMNPLNYYTTQSNAEVSSTKTSSEIPKFQCSAPHSEKTNASFKDPLPTSRDTLYPTQSDAPSYSPVPPVFAKPESRPRDRQQPESRYSNSNPRSSGSKKLQVKHPPRKHGGGGNDKYDKISKILSEPIRKVKLDSLSYLKFLVLFKQTELNIQECQEQVAIIDDLTTAIIRRNHSIKANDSQILENNDLKKKLNARKTDLHEYVKELRKFGEQKFGEKLSTTIGPRKPGVTTPMSSTAGTRNPTASENRNFGLVFDLADLPCFCQLCNLRTSSFSDFCSHLQDPRHTRSLQKRKPWSKARTPLDESDSRQRMRDIASIVSQEYGRIRVADVAKLLDPQREKEIGDDREREYPTNYIRGYEYLYPISGYYCILCDRASCDEKDAFNHVRSYEHVLNHTKLAATYPKHIQTFNLAKERVMNDSNSGGSVESTSSGNINRNRLPGFRSQQEQSSGTSKQAAQNVQRAVSYKKSTSRLVDEHESIASSFAKPAIPSTSKQDIPSNSKLKSDLIANKNHRLDRITSSSGVRSKISDNIKDLVRLGSNALRNEKGALKKLRDKADEDKASERKKEDDQPVRVNRVVEDKIDDDDDVIPLDHDKMDVDLGPDDEAMNNDDDDRDHNNGEDIDYDTRIENYDDIVTVSFDDEDSLFPGLVLAADGSTHIDALRDPKLVNGFKIVMNRVDLNDYEHMLNDPSTVMERMNILMAKKEPSPEEKSGILGTKKNNKDSTKVARTSSTKPIKYSQLGGNRLVKVEEEEENEARRKKDNSDKVSDVSSISDILDDDDDDDDDNSKRQVKLNF